MRHHVGHKLPHVALGRSMHHAFGQVSLTTVAVGDQEWPPPRLPFLSHQKISRNMVLTPALS